MKAKELRQLADLLGKAASLIAKVQLQRKRASKLMSNSGRARETLRRLKMSQSECANRLGVSPQAIRAALNPPYADSSLCYRISTMDATPGGIAAKHPRILQTR